MPPYKKYLILTVLFNMLSAVLNIFSFMALVPILQILFQTKETQEHFEYMAWGSASLKDVAMSNMNYYALETRFEGFESVGNGSQKIAISNAQKYATR